MPKFPAEQILTRLLEIRRRRRRRWRYSHGRSNARRRAGLTSLLSSSPLLSPSLLSLTEAASFKQIMS